LTNKKNLLKSVLMKTEPISLLIDKELKDGLDTAKQKDGRPLTWHLEKAIHNYLLSKKILTKG